jgi:hypothetical protein
MTRYFRLVSVMPPRHARRRHAASPRYFILFTVYGRCYTPFLCMTRAAADAAFAICRGDARTSEHTGFCAARRRARLPLSVARRCAARDIVCHCAHELPAQRRARVAARRRRPPTSSFC